MGKVFGLGKVLKNAFFTQSFNPSEVVNLLIGFAEKARREGLLTLEDEAKNTDNPFLQKGIQLVVDGTDPELVKDIMNIEIEALEERHSQGAGMLMRMGDMLPAFGMIGTLIGLVAMLANLDDPSTIGSSMAVALITTLYGAIMANLVAIPLGQKLGLRSGEEVLIRRVMVEGILSIQRGENPRIVKEKLLSFFSPDVRAAEKDEEEEEE